MLARQQRPQYARPWHGCAIHRLVHEYGCKLWPYGRWGQYLSMLQSRLAIVAESLTAMLGRSAATSQLLT